MKEKQAPSKSKEEILDQLYLSAYDLQQLIPKLSYQRALSYIEDAREDMKTKNYFIPEGKTKVALTKLIRKKFGF